MPRIKLIVEYDGSGFHGWQKQGELRTVQTELHRVLSVVLREEIGTLHVAGRTDAGVHARGQVVSFVCSATPDLRRLAQGVSHYLHKELAVVSAEVASNSFHPGRDATHKQYTYTILNRSAPAVLDARRVWHVHKQLNRKVMQEFASELVGEHDFSSLRDSECCATSPVKTIYSSELVDSGDLLYYRVIGSGFLKQMVRNIVGTLVYAGRGMLKVNSISELLALKDRRQAGVTAPAHGLTLDWVSYEPLPAEFVRY